MRRREFFAALGATTTAAATAGCAVLGDDASVDDGDGVELDAGRVTLGALGVRSSFVEDAGDGAAVHGESGEVFVVLDCDCRAYDGAVDDLPMTVAFDGERIDGATDHRVQGAGDGVPALGFPVPADRSFDEGAVVVDAPDREYRYAFDDAVRSRLANPPDWRVDVDWPDVVPAERRARAWTTATTDGDAGGALDVLLTHDDAPGLYWTHTYAVDADDEETFGLAFQCLCTDREELDVTVDWGLDATTRTLPFDP